MKIYRMVFGSVIALLGVACIAWFIALCIFNEVLGWGVSGDSVLYAFLVAAFFGLPLAAVGLVLAIGDDL